MFLFSLFIEWKCTDRQCITESGVFHTSLEYGNDSSKKIAIDAIKSVNNYSKIPTFILGPGNGRTNIVTEFKVFNEYIKNTTFYMLGYRGIDSDIKLEDSDIKTLATISESKITDKLLQTIANRTFSKVNVSNFWTPSRALDIVNFMKEEKIQMANVISIGETGSLICHQLLSDYHEYFNRFVIIGSSVPSLVHNETTPRLLGTYRRLCREDPANCPYQNIRWLPYDIPSSVLYAFKVSRERVIFATEHQLRNPKAAATAFDLLQTITDNSKMSYITFNTLPGPELLTYRWLDVAMHLCSTPQDRSFFAPLGLKHVCNYMPQLSNEFNHKFNSPILLVVGELDLPRVQYVSGFYKNNSINSENVEVIFLNKSNSKYDFGRPDIATEISRFLHTGLVNISNINQTQQIVWKDSFSATTFTKWIIGISVFTTLAISAFVMRNGGKEDLSERKERIRQEWARNQPKEPIPDIKTSKKQEKQRKDKRD